MGSAQQAAQAAADKSFQDLQSAGEKMSKVDQVDDEIIHVAEETTHRFLPKFEFKEHIFTSAMLLIITAIILFTVYVNKVMTTDRSDSLERWRANLEAYGITLTKTGELIAAEAAVSEDLAHLEPEIVLHFHHPTFDYPDGDEQVTHHVMDSIIVDPKIWDHLHFLFGNLKRSRTKAIQHAESNPLESNPLSPRSLAQQAMAAARSVSSALGRRPSSNEESRHVTLRDVRASMLQDMYHLLVTLGFNVMVFSSVDNDEIFLGVNLSRRSVIEHYLVRDHYSLQIQSSLVEKLGVQQDKKDPASCPPFVPYDPRTVKRMHKSGLISEDCGNEEIYQCFPAADGSHIISFLQRSMIIFKELNAYVHMNEAIHGNLLLSYYPVHHKQRVQELKATWADFRHLLDMSFVQPVHLIHRYFGPAVALMFAWTGSYSKALLPLVILGFGWGMLVRIVEALGIVGVLDTDQVIGFSIVLMLWIKIAENLWEREQSFLTCKWGISGDLGNEAKIKRSEFIGEMGPSEIDASLQDKHYPQWKLNLRGVISNTLSLLIFVFILTFYQIWMVAFSSEKSVVSSIILAGTMKVFEVVFKGVSKKLTDFENHKYEDDYYNSYIWKAFLFEFVNNYSAFFFITVSHEKDSRKCASGDCLADLRSLLSMALAVLSVCSLVQGVVNVALVEWAKYSELRALRQATGRDDTTHSYLEEQAKYLPYTEFDQIETMLPLVLSLGHTFLFGAVAPIVVPLTLLVFAVHLRVSAYLLVTTYRRTFPKPVKDLGIWKMIIGILMCTGLLYSSFLFVAYGETFSGTTMRAKLTGVIMYVVGLLLMWGLIGYFCPSLDSAYEVLQERRRYVLHKLLMSRRSGSETAVSADTFEIEKADLNFVAGNHAEVEAGAWDDIPRHADLLEAKKAASA